MGYWVTRTYTSGRVGEKTKYYVSGDKTRSKRKIKSAVKKQEQNDASAEKQLARLLNINFHKGDLLIGLDYSPEALENIKKSIDVQEEHEQDIDELIYMRASHELPLFIRRVKRDLAKNELDIMFVGVTSDMDGYTKESVRVHHHLVVRAVMSSGELVDEKTQKKINGDVLEVMKRKWTLGGVNAKSLRQQDDYTPIAHYFLEQVRKIADAKKYTSSRNLIRPTYKDRVVMSNAEIKIPAKCKILHRTEYTPHKPQYVRYLLPEVRDLFEKNNTRLN